jgi:F-type H+-transporting ATPase subunit b
MTRHHRALLAPLAAAVLGALLLAAAPAHAAEGLELVPKPERLIALLLLFVLLVPLLNGLLFRPLLAVLEERSARIEGARARAAEVSRRAAELVAKHDAAVRQVREAAQRERAGAVDEARRAQQAAIGEARGEAERQVAATRADVSAALDAARTGLRGEAEPLARDVAARLLGRSLS